MNLLHTTPLPLARPDWTRELKNWLVHDRDYLVRGCIVYHSQVYQFYENARVKHLLVDRGQRTILCNIYLAQFHASNLYVAILEPIENEPLSPNTGS